MLKTIQERIQAIPQEIRKVTASEAAQEIKENQGILIDVREPSESTESPVRPSFIIPRGILEMKVLEKFKNPDRPVYLHCASGVRAQLAAEQLYRLGYTQTNAIISDIGEIQNVFNQDSP